jgi:hypothetical protein
MSRKRSSPKPVRFRPSLERLEDRRVMTTAVLATGADYATTQQPEPAGAGQVTADTVAETSLSLVDRVFDAKPQEVSGAGGTAGQDDWFWGVGGGLSGAPVPGGVLHNDGAEEAKEEARPIALVTGDKWADTFLGGRWNGDGGVIDLGHGTDPFLPGGGSTGGGKDQAGMWVKTVDAKGITWSISWDDGVSRQDRINFDGTWSYHWTFSDGGSLDVAHDHTGAISSIEYSSNKHDEAYERTKAVLDFFDLTPADLEFLWMPSDDDPGSGVRWTPIGMKGSTLRPIGLVGGAVDPSEIEVLVAGIGRYDGRNVESKPGDDDGSWEKESSTLSMEAAMEANFYTDPPQTATAGAAASAAAQTQAEVNK